MVSLAILLGMACINQGFDQTFRDAMGHRQKKKLPSSVLLLLWPGEVRRKREGDSGQTGPALQQQNRAG